MKTFKEHLLTEKKVKVASKQEVELMVNTQYKNSVVYARCTVWNEDGVDFITYKRQKIKVRRNKNEYTGGIDWFGTIPRWTD